MRRQEPPEAGAAPAERIAARQSASDCLRERTLNPCMQSKQHMKRSVRVVGHVPELAEMYGCMGSALALVMRVPLPTWTSSSTRSPGSGLPGFISAGHASAADNTCGVNMLPAFMQPQPHLPTNSRSWPYSATLQATMLPTRSSSAGLQRGLVCRTHTHTHRTRCSGHACKTGWASSPGVVRTRRHVT